MASFLTLNQQRTAGAAARKAGGYDELIRLEKERRKAKGNGQVKRDASTGRVIFAAQKKPVSA
jgi:hypothetical protein